MAEQQKWSFPIIDSGLLFGFSWLDKSFIWGRAGTTTVANVDWANLWTLNRHRPFLHHYRGYRFGDASDEE